MDIMSTYFCTYMDYKLIFESGSSKTDVVLISKEKLIFKTQIEGLNPMVTGLESFSHSLEKFKNGLEESILELFHHIIDIQYFGAGIHENQKELELVIKDILIDNLSQKAQLSLHSDLLAACQSLSFGKDFLKPKDKIVCCILGTGSNVCVFDGKEMEFNHPSLGYIMADFGSGNKLGNKFLLHWVYNRLPLEVKSDFEMSYRLDYQTLIHKLYKSIKPNTFLASFSPFIYKHKESLKRDIIYPIFNEFIEMELLGIDGIEQYPIRFVGSIANQFKDELIFCLSNYGLETDLVISSPLENLIKYHQNSYNG